MRKPSPTPAQRRHQAEDTAFETPAQTPPSLECLARNPVRTGLASLDRVPAAQVFAVRPAAAATAPIAETLCIQIIVRLEGDAAVDGWAAARAGIDVVVIKADPASGGFAPQQVADAVRGLGRALFCFSYPVTRPLQTLTTLALADAALAANPELIVVADATALPLDRGRELAAQMQKHRAFLYLRAFPSCRTTPALRWAVVSSPLVPQLVRFFALNPPQPARLREAARLLNSPDAISIRRRAQSAARAILATGLEAFGFTTRCGQAPWILANLGADAYETVARLPARERAGVRVWDRLPLAGNWVEIPAGRPKDARRRLQALLDSMTGTPPESPGTFRPSGKPRDRGKLH